MRVDGARVKTRRTVSETTVMLRAVWSVRDGLQSKNCNSFVPKGQPGVRSAGVQRVAFVKLSLRGLNVDSTWAEE